MYTPISKSKHASYGQLQQLEERDTTDSCCVYRPIPIAVLLETWSNVTAPQDTCYLSSCNISALDTFTLQRYLQVSCHTASSHLAITLVSLLEKADEALITNTTPAAYIRTDDIQVTSILNYICAVPIE